MDELVVRERVRKAIWDTKYAEKDRWSAGWPTVRQFTDAVMKALKED